MPRRSNVFQKIVFLIKKHVAAGATVTESKFLQDRITGARREVDICVESKIADHDVVVSIECVDRKRRANVKWVEEMKAKHERLPTNALVLISRSGFTKEAFEVARTYGIETLTFGMMNEGSASRFFRNIDSLLTKTYTLTTTKVVIGVTRTGDLAEETVAVFLNNVIYTAEGEEIGFAREIVEILLHLDYVVKELGRIGDKSHKGFDVRWEHPRDKAGNPLCLQKKEPKVFRPISFIRIIGTCDFDVSEFRLRSGALGNVTVAWGTGSFFGKKALLVASEDRSGQKKLSISTENITVGRSETGSQPDLQ
jgi:hypothetical protein